MSRPDAQPEWASDDNALKLDPSSQRRNFGWSTSDNTTGGTPDKPNLQEQNGWQNLVWQWVNWLNSQTTTVVDVSSETVIDWSQGSVFNDNITADKTYSFGNIAEGQKIKIKVQNDSGGDLTVTFPDLVGWEDNAYNQTVQDGRANVYSFTAFEAGSIVGTVEEQNIISQLWPFGADGDLTVSSDQTIVVPNGPSDDAADYDNLTILPGVTLTLEPTDRSRPIQVGVVRADIQGTLAVAADDTVSGRSYSFTDPNGISFSGDRAADTARGGNGGRGGYVIAGSNSSPSGGVGNTGGGGGGGGGSGHYTQSGGNYSGGRGGNNGANGFNGNDTTSNSQVFTSSGGLGGQSTASNGGNATSNSSPGAGGSGYSGGGGATSWTNTIRDGAAGGGGGGGNKGGACNALYINAKTMLGGGVISLRGADGEDGGNAGQGINEHCGSAGGGGGPGGNGGLLWRIVNNDDGSVTNNVSGGSGGAPGDRVLANTGDGRVSGPSVAFSGQTGTAGQVFTS